MCAVCEQVSGRMYAVSWGVVTVEPFVLHDFSGLPLGHWEQRAQNTPQENTPQHNRTHPNTGVFCIVPQFSTHICTATENTTQRGVGLYCRLVEKVNLWYRIQNILIFASKWLPAGWHYLAAMHGALDVNELGNAQRYNRQSTFVTQIYCRLLQNMYKSSLSYYCRAYLTVQDLTCMTSRRRFYKKAG